MKSDLWKSDPNRVFVIQIRQIRSEPVTLNHLSESTAITHLVSGMVMMVCCCYGQRKDKSGFGYRVSMSVE